MIKQDVILLIMNCHRYTFKALEQKKTWIPLLSDSILYFHVLGDPLLTEPFKIDVLNHVLYVRCEDDYNSLPKKVIRAFSAIYSAYNFKYIFKTDDDQNVTDTKLFDHFANILLQSVPKVHYAGTIIHVPNAYKSEYYRIHPELPNELFVMSTTYCSGRFYALSADAVFCLLNKQMLIEKEFLEDYAIGFNLSSFLKITMVDFKEDINKYIGDIDFSNKT
jgi:hypothetical protein